MGTIWIMTSAVLLGLLGIYLIAGYRYLIKEMEERHHLMQKNCPWSHRQK